MHVTIYSKTTAEQAKFTSTKETRHVHCKRSELLVNQGSHFLITPTGHQ